MKKAGKTKANKPGSPVPADLARLEEVMKLMGRYDLGELDWERGDERIQLRSKGALVAAQYSAAPAAAVQTASSSAQSSAAPSAQTSGGAPAANSRQKQVPSPFVGTFYRAASPTSDPYVREGQAIKRGDVLCIIEAMKLMNEIEAEFPGKIVSVLVENGQPVEFGEPLFLVET